MNAPGLLSVSLLVCAAGCATVPDAAAGEAPLVLEEFATGRPVGAAVTHVESAGRTTYRISGGADDGALIHRETTVADRFNAAWMTVESIITEAGPMPRSTEYWSINEAGDAVLHATVDHEEEAITLFKPPLVTMPAQLSPAQEKTYTSDVRIVAEVDITRRKESGSATQVMRYPGSVTIRTAHGETYAAKIVIEFQADLAMADAFETTVRYIDPDAGILAIQRTRKVNILGMTGSEHHETLKLLSAKQTR